MGLLDAYQDSTDRALTVMAARPIDPEPPKPKHSGWSTIPRAVAGAFVETAGNIMDVASAYGQVQAATGANANPLIPDTPEDRKQRLEAYDKLKTYGIDWQPEESRPHYQMARDLRPDPITAGAAENIVFGLTKGLTKAIGAGMIAGPMAGAGAFGVSEGMTTAEDLAAQGVDPATRQKVGVITGAVSAVGMALPVAGSTLAKTAALVAVGGPASFVAQQAATRAILENADYGKLAQQYDPLDPVGLALATLLPAGFATWAKAGAISAAMKGKPKVVSDPAKVVTAEDSTVVAPVKPTATQDQVDAAMVHNLTLARDAHEAVPIEAVQTAMEPAKVQADMAEVLRPAVENSLIALHGSGAVFDEFQIMPGRNPALFFSPTSGRKTQAEFISEGPFGGNLYKVSIAGGKKFDPLNDPTAAKIYADLFPERAGKPGKFIEYPDIYIDSPLIQAMRENGYNRVRVYEPSVQAFSEAVTDPTLIKVLERNGEPVAQKVTPRDTAANDPAPAPVAKVGAGDTAPIDRSTAADPWNEPRTLEQRIADENIRSELLRMKNETGWYETGGRLVRNQNSEVAGDETISRTTWVPNAEWWPGRPKGLKEFEVKAAIDKAIAGEQLKAAERRTVEYMADVAEQRRKSEAWKPTRDEIAESGLAAHNELDIAMTARAAEIDPDTVESLATRFEADDAGFMRGIKELLDEHDRQTAASRQEGQRAPDATAAGQPDPGAGQQAEAVTQPKAGDTHITSILSRVEALRAQSPDLPVALREDGTPVTLAEELDAIRRQAREGTADTFGADDAPLIQVAVECLLSMGAA